MYFTYVGKFLDISGGGGDSTGPVSQGQSVAVLGRKSVLSLVSDALNVRQTGLVASS